MRPNAKDMLNFMVHALLVGMLFLEASLLLYLVIYDRWLILPWYGYLILGPVPFIVLGLIELIATLRGKRG
jgi:hypothetical protein